MKLFVLSVCCVCACTTTVGSILPSTEPSDSGNTVAGSGDTGAENNKDVVDSSDEIGVFNLSGRWIDSKGDTITITQDSDNLKIVYKNKTFEGHFEGSSLIRVAFGDRVCIGKITYGSELIIWSDNTRWER